MVSTRPILTDAVGKGAPKWYTGEITRVNSIIPRYESPKSPEKSAHSLVSPLYTVPSNSPNVPK